MYTNSKKNNKKLYKITFNIFVCILLVFFNFTQKITKLPIEHIFLDQVLCERLLTHTSIST